MQYVVCINHGPRVYQGLCSQQPLLVVSDDLMGRMVRYGDLADRVSPYSDSVHRGSISINHWIV